MKYINNFDASLSPIFFSFFFPLAYYYLNLVNFTMLFFFFSKYFFYTFIEMIDLTFSIYNDWVFHIIVFNIFSTINIGAFFFSKHPPMIYCNSQSVVCVPLNSVHHSNTKYIEADYHFCFFSFGYALFIMICLICGIN